MADAIDLGFIFVRSVGSSPTEDIPKQENVT